jgi:hypothetical protein
MSPATRVVKIAFRFFIWTFGLLFGLALTWFAANRELDEPASLQEITLARLAVDTAPDDHSVAAGIAGLSAPPGTDFMQYGVRVRAMARDGVADSQVRAMIEGPGTLQPTVAGKAIDCWGSPDWPVFEGCLPFDQMGKVLADNKELLQRFKALYALDGHTGFSGPYNAAFLTAMRLAVVDIQNDLREGRVDDAYGKWRDLFRFVRNNLRATDTWAGRTLGLVALGLTFPALDSMLFHHPELAKAHGAELLELLKPEGVTGFGPDGIVRGEFRTLADALNHPRDGGQAWAHGKLEWLAFHLGQKNRILNRYAEFAKEYAYMLRLPLPEMGKEAVLLETKFAQASDWEMVIDPFGSLFLNRFIGSELQAKELVRQMLIYDGRLRLATLLVELINQNVKDADIPKFLTAAGPRFADPFAGKPALWDAKGRNIYFPDPRDKCENAGQFRVRVPAGVKNVPSPETYASQCEKRGP